MKIFILLISVITFSQIFAQQTMETRQTNKNTAITDNSLKVRPACPAVKVKKEYRIRDEGADPYLVSEIKYDRNGNILEENEFDFFGSNEITGSIENKYEGNNKVSRLELEKGSVLIAYKYEYNSKGWMILESWSSKHGSGYTEFTHNDEGKVVEEKYYTVDETLDYSRVYKYDKDEEKGVEFEEKWEVYTDDTPKLLQYRRGTAFENGLVSKKVNVNEEGNPTRLEEYTYNNEGLRTIVVVSSSTGNTKEVTSYNEYGEPIESITYTIQEDKSERLDVHLTTAYNKFGQESGYIYLKGSTDSYGSKFEYEYFEK